MIWPQKSLTRYLQLGESDANILFDVFFNLAWSHHRLEMSFFAHISSSLRWENMLLHTLQQKTSTSNLGVFLSIMSMVVTWHLLRAGGSDMYPTRKVSFKGTLVIGVQQGNPSACAPGSCLGCNFTRRKHPDFSCITCPLIFCRVHVTQWLLCQTDEIKTIFKHCTGYICGCTREFPCYCWYLLIASNIFL